MMINLKLFIITTDMKNLTNNVCKKNFMCNWSELLDLMSDNGVNMIIYNGNEYGAAIIFDSVRHKSYSLAK